MKGRMRGDEIANRYIEEALLCKMFKCTPKELYDMEWDQVEYYRTVYGQLLKENPMAAFF